MSKRKYSINTILFFSFVFILALFIFLILFFNGIYQKKQMEIERELILKNAVMHAYTLAEIKYDAVVKRGLNIDLAKEHIKTALLGEKKKDGTRTMDSNYSLGENGYFIIYSLKGDEIAHPSMEGKNVYNERDKKDKDKFIVQDQINLALNGGGFYSYNWNYPGDENKIGKKISYVKYFKPWKWVIVATTYEKDLNVYFSENEKSFILTGIFITLLMIPLVYFVSKRITKPLAKLNNKIRYFTNNLEITNDENNTNIKEVFELGKSFSDLSEELSAYIEELQGLNEEIESLNSENSMIIEKMNILLDETTDILDEENEEEFLIKAFENLYNLIPESSSGVLGIIKDKKVEFISAKNFNKDKLNNLSLDKNVYVTYDIVFKSKDIKTIRKELLNQNQKEALNGMIKEVKESLYIPLNGHKKQVGNLILHCNKDGGFTKESFRIGIYYSKLISLFLTIKNMNDFESNIQKQIIIALVKMMEYHDTYTRGHSQNVADLAEEFSKFLGYNSKFTNKIYWSGMVHDVGKIVIPQYILNKPSKLTHDEFDLIKKHPVYAFEVLNEIDNLKDISYFVKYHHERVDGNGYPDKLKDKKIPIESKILCIADTWDAMTRDRAYRKALSRETAINELIKNKGKQFDSYLVDKFIDFLKKDEI